MAYQYGNDNLANMSPDELALLLGQSGYRPGYDSNDSGSAERNYNNILNTLTPDQLLKRYGQGSQGSYGTALDQSQYQAYNTFKSLFGRDPSTNELAQVIPAFQGPNGLITGRAFLANLQNQYKTSPNLDPGNAMNNRKPEDVNQDVNGLFQSILGRTATADELQHFSQALSTNQIDSYGLSSFLKQQPEYTNSKDKDFRGSLSEELQGYDRKAFNNMKGDVISAYGKNGMAAGFDQNGNSLSPSLDYALTDMMGKIAENRGNYLAGLSAQQYGGNKDLAIGNYKGTLDQMYNQNQQQRSSQQNYGNALLDRGFQGADYSTQMNDYMNFLSNQKSSKSMNPIYGQIGGLVGAGAGAFFGGPGGAQVGYNLGQGAGNTYGYLNS